MTFGHFWTKIRKNITLQNQLFDSKINIMRISLLFTGDIEVPLLFLPFSTPTFQEDTQI